MIDSEKTRILGNPSNFWLFNEADGFDLTHPATPTSPPLTPRLRLETTNDAVTISPEKSALVIIDMQNFFLSSALGRGGPGIDAEKQLLDHAIPAARRAGIQVVWLNWGLTEEDLKTMPPSLCRIFNSELRKRLDGVQSVSPNKGQEERSIGLGDNIGEVALENGKLVDGGRLLMRDQWNTALHPPLLDAYQEGLSLRTPDLLFHKNRESGMCDAMTKCKDYLQSVGIRTLMFAGVNTDQCVLGTLTDARLRNFDVILLKDGTGTTTGDFAQKTCEYNCSRGLGFVTTCEKLAAGVDAMLREI